MNRAELQRLSAEHLADATSLLREGRWGGAYYLAGYSLELGLKSCILAHIERTGRIFDDSRYLKDLAGCWMHDLDALVNMAGLVEELYQLSKTNSTSLGFWIVAKKWEESSRYRRKGQADAEALLEAITHSPDGFCHGSRSSGEAASPLGSLAR